ncbi:tubulin-specific chaperone C [Orcinus orca]|uniref:tubulin-specific chaperone C n=1 Tax=Orcinus orca TaxID=9733 RepID=UPI001440F105|nr:tubulin-specific chaperone C [Orcinus orca]
MCSCRCCNSPHNPGYKSCPFKRKKSFPRLPSTLPIHKDLCLPTHSVSRPRPIFPPPPTQRNQWVKKIRPGSDVSMSGQSQGALVGGLALGAPGGRKAGERKLEGKMENASGSATAVASRDLGSQRGRSLVPERLQSREHERQLEVERRKQKRQNQEVEEEKSDFFAAAFSRERLAVEELLEGGESVEQLEEAAARLQGLQKLVNDSVLFLAAYDLRQGQEVLARLQEALAKRRQELQPKKRFAFKTRRKDAASATKVDLAPGAPAAEGILASPPPLKEEEGFDSSWICGFSNLQSQVLEKRAEELHQRDVLLTQLINCTIKLYGNPNTLRLTKARGCTLLCGPVSTSVFLENCNDCVLAVACQQLRVHTTKDTRIFLQVTSRAIVEDCTGIQFAPYTWSYPGIDKDFEGSGLDRSKNNWSDVDDFNWLARDVASPNWSILPEEERRIQ